MSPKPKSQISDEVAHNCLSQSRKETLGKLKSIIDSEDTRADFLLHIHLHC